MNEDSQINLSKINLSALAKAVFQYFGLTSDQPIGFNSNGQLKNVDAGAGYLVYTAVLSQSGEDAPTANVKTNTLGAVVWTRVSIGTYNGTLAGAFPSGRTWYVCAPNSSQLTLARIDANVVQVSGGGDDDQLVNFPIEIRVYPS